MMSLPALALGVETSWDRKHTAICAAGWDPAAAVWRCELLDYTESSDVAKRVQELRRRPNVRAVAVDPVSPAAPIADALRRKIKLAEPSVRDIAAATAEIVDLLRGGGLKLADQPALTNAARHVKVRQAGGGVAFDRRSDVDMSPLVAAALALWAARRLRTPTIHAAKPPGSGSV